MKGLLLIWLSLGVGVEQLQAQENHYEVTLSSGFYQAPKYEHVTRQLFLGADFNYHIQKRWMLTIGFVNGQFTYFDDYRSNVFSYDDHTNAKGRESHLYLTAAYSIVHTSQFVVQIGLGLGQLTQRLSFPFQAPTSYGSPGLPGGTIFMAELSHHAVEVPLKFDAFYRLNKRIGLGLRAGAFLQFNRPLLGAYIGPQLRVRL